MSAHDAHIIAAIGASGSGKSLWVKAQLRSAKPSRLVVWDFKREYPIAPAESLRELARAMQRDRFAVSWHPSADPVRRWAEFDLVCRMVQTAGRCTLVVEELAFVTSPMKAPAAWRSLTLTGRHEGLVIIGTSQRPASIDKDYLGNCTLLHCHRVNSLPDVDTMARMLMVEKAEVAGLQNLEFIERATTTGEIFRGKVRLPAKPKATA